MDTLIAAAAAVGAGMLLAVAGVLQQRSASRRPSGEGLAMAGHLLRDRIWLLGISAAVASYGLQALALTFGTLTLVQPLIVSELLFAVPVSVRLRGLRLRPRDWLAIVAIIVGLTVGIVSADPQGGEPRQPFLAWVPALVAVVVVAGGALVAARTLRGPVKASMYALAAAVVLGTQSALFAATIAYLRTDIAGAFTHWETYTLVVASLIGLLLIQKAFQSGPLAASTSVTDAVLPLVAISLGVGLFGEQITTTVPGLTGAAVGLALLITGIVGLDTSPVVRKEQRIERREQRKTAEREQP
ncbi:MAG: DMT family transporter [Pseudonocardia sp.]|nr:DMT family transporter [Pseudonocardia sp.]